MPPVVADLTPWVRVRLPRLNLGMLYCISEETAMRRDNALFISDVTTPDGTVLPPGQTFLKTWRVRNGGNTVWTGAYRLGFFDDEALGAPALVAVPFVRPGETADVSVTLTAPDQPGRYKSTWRLRNADNQFFGARLFADIVVAAPEAADSLTFITDVTIADGTRVRTGQIFDKVWRVRNSGGRVWGDGYRLVLATGDGLGAPDPSPLPPTNPGQTVDISLTLTAPDAPGRYVTTWRVMTPDGRSLSDLFVDIQVVQLNPPDDARFVKHLSLEPGSSVAAGSTARKAWRIRNTGGRPWETGYELALIEGDALGAPPSVAAPPTTPGQEAEITVELSAPETPGMYRNAWQMRNPQGALFGDVVGAEISVPTPAWPTPHNAARLAGHAAVPLGERLAPGQPFDKMWLVENSGDAAWGSGYSLAFVSGDRLEGPESVAIPFTPPGNSLEAQVSLIAPNQPGLYRAVWRLRDPAGNLFGAPLIVSIVVEESAETFDLLDYLRGDGRLYNVRGFFHGREYNEIMQTQHDGQTFYHTKNRLWEELFYDDDFIYRGADVSPGNHPRTGEPYFYTLRTGDRHGGAWLRRRMAVGDLHNQIHTVIEARKSDCRVITHYPHSSYLKFLAHHPQRMFQSGVVVADVIELTWIFEPDATPVERYFYARDFGLVGWEGSAGRSGVSEIFAPGARPANVREFIPCLAVLIAQPIL